MLINKVPKILGVVITVVTAILALCMAMNNATELEKIKVEHKVHAREVNNVLWLCQNVELARQKNPPDKDLALIVGTVLTDPQTQKFRLDSWGKPYQAHYNDERRQWKIGTGGTRGWLGLAGDSVYCIIDYDPGRQLIGTIHIPEQPAE